MDIKNIINKILGRHISKDSGKNFERGAFSESDRIYAPFRPYADQYTPGRHPSGINIMQKRKNGEKK